MSETDDDYENDYEDIRVPDEILREKLLDNNSNISEPCDDELNQAINLSSEEYRDFLKKMYDNEKELMENIEKDKKKRSEICEPILFELKKLSRFDNNIKNMYDILEPILDGYINLLVDKYDFDIDTHKMIFDILSTLRIKRENIEFLKTIILIT
jgi:hypothetical protein